MPEYCFTCIDNGECKALLYASAQEEIRSARLAICQELMQLAGKDEAKKAAVNAEIARINNHYQTMKSECKTVGEEIGCKQLKGFNDLP